MFVHKWADPPPPRPTSVPSEHIGDLAPSWPAASQLEGAGQRLVFVWPRPRLPPCYNYRHQHTEYNSMIPSLLTRTINTPPQVYIDWINASYPQMGHFQDLVKGKWELNQLFLTRENSFKFLVADNYNSWGEQRLETTEVTTPAANHPHEVSAVVTTASGQQLTKPGYQLW